jgi:hypothetical protein
MDHRLESERTKVLETRAKRLARVAVVFSVKDCDIGAAQEDGSRVYTVKCNVPRRVRVKQLRNPTALLSGKTYLRAEVEPYEDVDPAEDCSDLERKARTALEGVMRLQAELGDKQPGLRPEVLKDFTFGRDGFWKLVDLWQDFQSHKLVTKRAAWNREMVKKILEYVKANQDSFPDPSEGGELAVPIESLPSNIQNDMKNLQESTTVGVEEFRKRALVRIQAFVQSQSHEERLEMMIETFAEEQYDLAARLALNKIIKK